MLVFDNASGRGNGTGTWTPLQVEQLQKLMRWWCPVRPECCSLAAMRKF